MPQTIIALLISYLIGSIPTAYIFGRLLKGIDIRTHGSGNVGATNAMRVLGKRAGIAVLTLDVIKGIVPVVCIPLLIPGPASALCLFHARFWHMSCRLPPGEYHPYISQLYLVLIGIACICGHNWTIFLQFRGGKGIATTLGVLIGLSTVITGLGFILLLVVVTWVIVFIIFRIVSIASVAAGISLPIFLLSFFPCPPGLLFATSFLLSVFVVIRHRTNLVRFLHGKEPRISFGRRNASGN